jgi:RecJ-like exonuclease
MANFMFILRPTEKVSKTVCPVCAERGEVLDSCPMCKGSAIKKNRFTQYYVQDKPIQIEKVDRDPKTGILRYWENTSEFYYDTTYPTLNKYVPEVPYGVHLCHDTRESAQVECDRINACLTARAKADNFESMFSL